MKSWKSTGDETLSFPSPYWWQNLITNTPAQLIFKVTSLTICPAAELLLGMLIFNEGLLGFGGGVTACGCGDTEFRPPVTPEEGVTNEPSLPWTDPGVTLLLLYSAAATKSDMFCVFPEENELNWFPWSRFYITISLGTKHLIEIEKFLQTAQKGFYASQNKLSRCFWIFLLILLNFRRHWVVKG